MHENRIIIGARLSVESATYPVSTEWGFETKKAFALMVMLRRGLHGDYLCSCGTVCDTSYIFVEIGQAICSHSHVPSPQRCKESQVQCPGTEACGALWELALKERVERVFHPVPSEFTSY